MANDDDLCKLTIRWPEGLHAGIDSLELTATGIAVDHNESNRSYVTTEVGQSKVAFLSASGARLTFEDEAAWDVISGNSEIANSLITLGSASIFVEGIRKFGTIEPVLGSTAWEHDSELLDMAESAAAVMGGACITLGYGDADKMITQKTILNKGGFWRFVIPTTNAPLPSGGVLGSLEFRDGRGRLNENQTDLGSLLQAFAARSGIRGGADQTVEAGGGHIPIGWYLGYRRTDFSDKQRDSETTRGEAIRIRQGAYVRWRQDDAVSTTDRYTSDFIYDSSFTKDRRIGRPVTVRFKWQLEPIRPNWAFGRTQLQIHPDGKKNGTMGCIGIQSYVDCLSVNRILTDYNQCNLLVQFH